MIYKDKFKTANNLDEIIIASTNYVNEDLKHTRKDSFKEFARGDVLIRVGSNDYSAKVIVGFTKGNEMVLYDIINFVPEKLDIKKIDTQYRPTTENVESDRTSVSITNSISENRNNVNTKNDESSNDIKYSMGGLKAETADKSALEKAMELEKDGTDSEKIRKETGWFKGYDGKWRFEIDDSELEFKTDIEKNRAAAIELAKMKVKSAELEEKIVNNTATKAEENVQTMYSGKNKGSLATTPSGKISYSQTSETLSGTASTISLLQENNNVNKKINKITQSQQFVRWFGDWQNKPKTASKVVDGNGEPLVVYHQTGNDFTVFDTKHTGAGEFDSEMPTGIFMKPTNSNIGLSGNKQMALYANIRNPFIANSRKELVDFYIKNIDGYSDAKNEVKRIDSEYKQKFQDEMKRENQEYQKLWVARKNGEISEEEYQKAVSRDALDDLLEEWHNKVNEASKKAKSLIDDYFRNSNYDGVIVNNDVGSFGRSTKTYIAFSNTQVKSATDNIGTFDGKNSDIRYAVDDTINDWLDDESTPQGIDFDKAVEKNPVIAVAKIYKSAAQTAKSGLAQGKNVKLDEKEYLRIAGSIMQTYRIKGKYNPNYKKELASQLKNFVDSIGKKDANFTDLFEELVNDCKGGILLSGGFDKTLMREEREFVLDMLQGKVLLIKPRDVQQIEEDYGSVANYRKKMFGKTYVAVKNKEREEYKKNILKPVANSLLAEATYLNSYLKTLIKNMLLYIIIMRTDIFQNMT